MEQTKDLSMWITELEAKVQALEAERDALRDLVIEVLDNNQIMNTRDVVIDMDTLRKMTQAITKGGNDGK